jgi:hypothetical protein
VARSPAGESRKDFQLTVQIKPIVDDAKSSPAIINSVHGAELKIDCVVEAIPKATVSFWFKIQNYGF